MVASDDSSDDDEDGERKFAAGWGKSRSERSTAFMPLAAWFGVLVCSRSRVFRGGQFR